MIYAEEADVLTVYKFFHNFEIGKENEKYDTSTQPCTIYLRDVSLLDENKRHPVTGVFSNENTWIQNTCGGFKTFSILNTSVNS